MPSQAFTVRQTCALLAVSKATLYRYVAAGLIKPVRFGVRGTRFLADEIKRFQLNAQEQF